MRIRRAKADENNILSQLAYKAKSYWGYSEDFLNKCRDDLTVTSKYIQNNNVYVLEKDKIIAFYSLSNKFNKLDALFIDPEYIGSGLGKLIWSDILQKASDLKMKEFSLESEPFAEGFYQKMGAIRIGEINSKVFPERKLPLLKVKVI